MPRTVLSIKAEIRDHSMSIPAPENTTAHGIPNACNQCHKDRDAKWAGERMDVWYGPASRQKLIRRADVFAAARNRDPEAIPKLIAILEQPAEGPLVRGNAVGYLTGFSSDTRAFAAVERALGDAEPLIRAIAALRISPGVSDRPRIVTALTQRLGDSSAVARIAATVSLVSLGIHELPGEDGRRFEAGKQLFRARAELNTDDAAQQLGAGKFYLLTGDPATAIGALETSIKLEPDIPARYYLAYAYAQRGQMDEARKILLAIPPADSQYIRAQALLKALQ